MKLSKLWKCAGIVVLGFLTLPVHGQDALTAASAVKPGIAVANIDRSVKPGDDFYMYANGD